MEKGFVLFLVLAFIFPIKGSNARRSPGRIISILAESSERRREKVTGAKTRLNADQSFGPYLRCGVRIKVSMQINQTEEEKIPATLFFSGNGSPRIKDFSLPLKHPLLLGTAVELCIVACQWPGHLGLKEQRWKY
jgi:hypothetical protein